MRTRFLAVSISSVALLAAGCDPEAPVQSSDVSQEIDSAVAVHAADAGTHGNLLLPAANVSGEFDSDQIADGAIGNSELDINSVGSEEIADQTIAQVDMGAGSVGAAQIVDLSITSAKLALGSVGPAQIAANSIGAGQMAAGAISGGVAGTITDNTIGTADIQNGSVASLDIAADTITAGNIATDAVDSDEIAAGAVQAAEIDTDAVTTAKIMNANVTTAKIMDANVTTAKLADKAIIQAKLNTDMAGEGTMGAAFNTIFTINVPATGTVNMVVGCESDVAASQVRLEDNNQMIDVTCPDTNLAGPVDIFLLSVTTNMANEDVLVRYKSQANGDTTRWRIYSITYQ